MLLTISTAHEPATDLGFLLHKHPDRLQSKKLPFGTAHFFYPEAEEARCTFALLLDINPVDLVRGKPGQKGAKDGLLAQYVSDRPYAASSFLSVALSRVLASALAGRSESRPELAEAAIPLTARITPLPCRGAEDLLPGLFEPLGYTVERDERLLDENYPDWGASPYAAVSISATCRLKDLLSHLYVLIPVLDNRKHYFVGENEVEKLLRFGEGWLAAHPMKELVARRYLKHRKSLARQALERLVGDEEAREEEAGPVTQDAAEQVLEKPIRLYDRRLEAVVAAVKESGARRVLDLGCGSGQLLRALLKESQFEEVVGLDVSIGALEYVERRLRLDRMTPRQRGRIRLLQGALTYRDSRLDGFEAAVLMEVIEHLDLSRLDALERSLFGASRPGCVVVTTPNREFNARFETLPAGAFRHPDHRFEWTRAEFRAWAGAVCDTYGYTVRYHDIGEFDPDLGAPTQMAVFKR